MPWNFGAGVAAAAGVGGDLMADSIKRDRNLQDATNLEALKHKVEQDKLDRIASIVKGVSRTTDTPIAGPTEDGSSLGTAQQPKSDSAYSRDVGDALTGAGFIDQGAHAYQRADTYDVRKETADARRDTQKSNDEKWRASQDQAERFHKDTLKLQQQQLNLRGKDSADFAKAADSYIEGKGQYDSLVAEGKGNDPDVIAAAKQQMDRAALQLRQFKVDVGGQSESEKRIQLSASLTAATKIVDNPMSEPATVEMAKVAQRNILKEMASLTGGKPVVTDGVSDFDAKFPPKTGSKPAATAAGGKPATAAQPFNGIEANLMYPQINGNGMIQVRDKM